MTTPTADDHDVANSAHREVAAVGSVLRDDRGRILLILRGNEPDREKWSLPGGRVERGESAAEAAVREMREETGLDVVVHRLLGQVRRAHPDGGYYVIDDFEVRLVGGNLTPASDALDARWFHRSDLDGVPATSDLVAALESWGLFPEPDSER